MTKEYKEKRFEDFLKPLTPKEKKALDAIRDEQKNKKNKTNKTNKTKNKGVKIKNGGTLRVLKKGVIKSNGSYS